MKRVAWAVVLLAAIAFNAQADGPAPGTTVPREEGIPIERIEKALKSYADAIGCNLRFDRRNIVLFDIIGDRGVRYVAYSRLDPGCAGGSSTIENMFVILQWGGYRSDRIFVSPGISQPAAAAFGFPPYIDRIFVKGNQLWYTGKVHDWSKDSPNSPSVPVEGEVLLRKGVVDVDKKQNFGAAYWLSIPQY